MDEDDVRYPPIYNRWLLPFCLIAVALVAAVLARWIDGPDFSTGTWTLGLLAPLVALAAIELEQGGLWRCWSRIQQRRGR